MEKKIRKCLSARDNLVLAFIIMEYYVSFLCFSRRKSRTSLALVIKLAVEISKFSFCIRSLKSNSSVYGHSFLISIFSIRLSLIEEYMRQLIKKWLSSSTRVKQKGHFRLCTARGVILASFRYNVPSYIPRTSTENWTSHSSNIYASICNKQ